MNEFVHTHVHSDYSILDASISVEDLVAEVAAKGMKSLALTDHGNVHAWVHFAEACKKHGIKPIFGCELYVARHSAQRKMDKFAGNPTDHLVVLAQNDVGRRNILRLVTEANDPSRFSYVPRVDLDLLEKHSEGIIAQTACLSGGVNRLLRGWKAYNRSTRQIESIPPDYEAAKRLALRLQEIFGRYRFFLEVQMHRGQYQDDELVQMQEELNRAIYQLAQETGIPMVGTNDIHFKHPNDAGAREMAFKISRGKKTEGLKYEISHAGELYVKTPDEMWQAFGAYKDESLLKNTLWIADQCNATLETGVFHFPDVIIDGRKLNEQEIQELWEKLIREGTQFRYKGELSAEAQERLDYEKGVIERMGFVPYFIMTWDAVNFARRNRIPIGPGRGSVGGCFIAYLLRIHDTDTLRFGLLFERFLNPDRISMPDIDLDFCKDRRSEVVQYLVEKYGHDRVAQIVTFGNFWAKSVIRETGKYLDLPQDQIDDLAKAIPDSQGDFRITIGEALDTVPKIRALKTSPDPRHEQLIRLAQGVEGIKRSVSTHACGIIIADKPLTEYTALMPVKDDPVAKLKQTQFDMNSLESIGLLKMDALALDALTRIARAEAWIAQRHGVDFYVRDDKAFDDPLAWSLIQQGRTVGCFQIETGPMRELCMRVMPSTMEELSATVALYRPGPLDFKTPDGLNMIDHFVNRKHGYEEPEPPHPKLRELLEDTFGVIIYQEQVMKISQILAGYSGGRADLLRKVMGKKKREAIHAEMDNFIPAVMKHSGLTEVEAKALWDQIEAFGRYGFNLAHSVEYATITYWTAKIKAHYPVEFMASCLTSAAGVTPVESEKEGQKNEQDTIKYIDECNRLGIRVLPVDVNESDEGFIPEGDAIRAGLCSVKGVGSAALKVMSARLRAGGGFSSFREMVKHCVMADVNKSALEALVMAGACSGIGEPNQMLAGLKEESKVQRAGVKKVGDAPNLIQPPEQLPSVMPMPEKLRQAYALELVGAYDIPEPEPSQIAFRVSTQEDLEKVVKLVRHHPGKIAILGRLDTLGHEVDFSLGTCAASILTHLRKAGIPVRET